MESSLTEAELVLDALSDVYALQDPQALCDRVCESIVRISEFRVALLSLYFGEDVYIGLEGGDEEMRQSFLDTARRTVPERRRQKRDEIWTHHRIPKTNICFIPEGSGIRFSNSFSESEEVPGAEWRPKDRLMVFVRGVYGDVHGVLSLDEPRDGKRPDPAQLGSLGAVDRFMKLMGVQIHNRHLARKLQESEERYAAVVEQGHDGMLIARADRVLFANRRIAEMVGVDPPDLVDRTVGSVIRPGGVASLPGEEEGLVLRDDGSTIDVSIRRSKLRFGEASATLVAVADITERKRVFSQLLRAQKMESVGTLASGVAHDFNNLLGGIMGYASLLRMRLGTEHDAARHVVGIEKAAERASQLTRQLLGIVRDQEFLVAPLQVGRIVEEVANFLSETLDPSIEIRTRIPARLPMVLGDETQIHQVLLNVCLNARDAMPEGGRLTLEAASIASPLGGNQIRLTIRDTGCGIPQAILTKVFDPFFTTKDAGEGTGLGLYLAYRIVQRHGGSVDISSEPERGTTVEILLPASGGVGGEVEGTPETEETRSGGQVLIVDDEELMREVAREMVERIGYEAILAANGLEAVDAVRERPGSIDCVIMDVAMPVMDGWEATRRIHELEPDLPVIVSSGHDFTECVLNRREGVFGEMLVKPYRIEQMRGLLYRIPRRDHG